MREPDSKLFVDWTPYLGHEWTADHDTSFPMKRLQELGQQINTVPAGFSMQRQVEKTYEDRRKMAAGALPCNWGFAETLAYATLIDQNIGVRFTGQDVGRGTFSHRQATLHDQKTGEPYTPSSILLKNSRDLNCSIRFYLKRQCSLLNMDTRLLSLVVWRSGKRNLATLPTERRSSLINSSLQVSEVESTVRPDNVVATWLRGAGS